MQTRTRTRTLAPVLCAAALALFASSSAAAATPDTCFVAKKRGPIKVDVNKNAPWVDFESYSNYAPVDAVLVGRTVYLRGLAENRWDANKTIASVPSASSDPKARMIFSAVSGERGGSRLFNARVDVHDGGSVGSEVDRLTWVSLSGIAWPVGTGQPLTLATGFTAYGRGYRAPLRYGEGDVIRLTGLAKGTVKTNAHVASIPSSWAPPGRRIFLANNHEGFTRVDVFANGAVVAMSDAAHGWVSLDGIAYSTQPANPIDMTAYHWTAYGAGYAPPSINQSGGVVYLSGLAKRSGGVAYRQLFNLFDDVKPAKREVFWVLSANGPVRVDVFPDGKVEVQGDPGKWVSLDGISFLPKATAIATGVAFPTSSTIDQWGKANDPDPAFAGLPQWRCKEVGGKWVPGTP
ncbi:MAG: hypothetical protein KC420_13390 [Myxococcales bacterium]|nr:hypothetical protein [Myxococcales bacterium]